MAFIRIRLDRNGGVVAAAPNAAVSALPEVLATYVTAGEFGLLLQVVIEDLDAYRRFSLDRLLRIPGIRNIRTNFVIDTPLEGRPMPLNHLP